MNLSTIFNNYIQAGYSNANAISKTCQDVILFKISNSNMSKNITIKGGVAMMAISNDKRRATQDLDIDFIRYSLKDSAIKAFIEKLNDNEIKIKILPPIKELHHQDYDGRRVFVEITDNYNNSFSTKIDIGVHKDINIKQDELCFDLGIESEDVILLANSKEQICCEKIKSLLKFGITSTRYKDIFDIYYLIETKNFDKKRFINYAQKIIFNDTVTDENSIQDIEKSLKDIFENRRFRSMLDNAKNNWIELPIEEVIGNIIEFLSTLEMVEV